MKKRIIALILVVVMSAITLMSCGEYDYADAKLDKFSSVNTQALKDALANLEIEDEDEFSADPEKRKAELHDIVLRSLLNAENADKEEYKNGTIDYADALYYCYYATVLVEGKEHIINFTNSVKSGSTTTSGIAMDPAYKTYIQFGIKENTEDPFIKAIEEKFNGYEMKEENSFELNTKDDDGETLKVKAGDTVLLTFDYKDEEGKVTKEIKLYVTIPADETAEVKTPGELKEFGKFLNALVGKKVGSKLSSTSDKFDYEISEPESQDGEETETPETKKSVSYTNVTVNGVSNSVAPVDVVFTAEYPDDDKKEVKDVFGNTVDLKGKEVTCYVFPIHIRKVNYIETPETKQELIDNATVIITVFYGSASIQDLTDENGTATGDKIGALDIFTNTEYKLTYTVDEKEETKTFKELMEEFVKVQKEFETAKSAYDKANDTYESKKTAFETAEKSLNEMLDTLKKYETQLVACNEAKAAVDAAQKALDEAEEGADTTELQAALDAAQKAFAEAAAWKENTKYDADKAVKEIESITKMITQTKTSINGDPSKKDDIGLKGTYDDAKGAYIAACKALYGHEVDEEGKCTKCVYVDPAKCTHKNEEIAGVKDCKCDICGEGYEHVDVKNNKDEEKKNPDCKCDLCGEEYNHEPAEDKCVCLRCAAKLDHVDEATKDCKCDKCGAALTDAHVDADKDGKCDKCTADYKAKEEEEKKSAKAAYDEALAERDTFLKEKIFSDKMTKPEEAKDIQDVIVAEFEESVYDTLEETYFNAMNTKIMTAVYAIIDKYVTVDRDKLPGKAVNEMYEKIYEGHKYTFYSSAGSTSATGNYYEIAEGDFEAYLTATVTKTDNMKDAKKVLKEEAKDYVVEIVKIYQAARALGLEYTKEEFKEDYKKENSENKQQWSESVKQWAQIYWSMGVDPSDVEYEDINKQDLHIANQADKLFNHLLEIKKDDDGKPEVDAETLLFGYKNISYKIKAETKE